MPSAYSVTSGTADVQVFSRPCVVTGCSFRESASTPAAATIILRNGTSASAPIVATIEIPADGSMADNYEPGIYCHDGLYVDRVAGTTEGVVYVK